MEKKIGKLFRFVTIVIWLSPDIVMFLSSIIIFVVLKKLTAPPANEDIEENATSSINATSESIAEEDEGGYSPEQYVLLKRTGLLNHIKI